jgi:hypothetical protein
MNRFAFLTLYRSLIRHRLYAALNIGGLAIGIAVFLVLGLYVRFETSYETWLPRNDRIYIVQTVWNMPDSPFNGAYPNTMGGLLEEMKADFPAWSAPASMAWAPRCCAAGSARPKISPGSIPVLRGDGLAHAARRAPARWQTRPAC